tara:strand:- start:1247 stop:1921 length:675 start_codon:yes stop_codon:yes gene_type:complete
MTIIFKNKTCKIKKLNQQKYKLTILSEEKFKHFWTNIKKNIKIIEEKKTYFIFEAEKVNKLTQLQKNKRISYNLCKTLFLNIGEQYEYLEKDKYGNLFLNDDDIIFIDYNKEEKDYTKCFLYLNTEHFSPIIDNKIKIKFPFKKDNLYLSPEMSAIKSFPIEISTKSIYYSIAMLVINIFSPFKTKNTIENIKEHIEEITETKLYWALLRCLEINPEDRFYLYI